MSASVSFQNKAVDEDELYEAIDDLNDTEEARTYSNLHGTSSPGNNGARSDALSTEKNLQLPLRVPKQQSSFSYGKKLLVAVAVPYVLFVSVAGVLLWHIFASGFEREEAHARNEIKHEVNGTWTDWEGWGTCSTTCGVGIRNRVRRCRNSRTTSQETACEGVPQEYESCETGTCAVAVHGNWGPWGVWSSCSSNCTKSLQLRHRTCTSPAPTKGGSMCIGTPIQYKLCGDVCEVRLVYDNSLGIRYGRVEIYHGGEWGTVCDDDFDDADASVVCKMFGYRYGFAEPSAVYGEGSGQIWLDNVNCTGVEDSIQACAHQGWGVENCDHDEDAGVDCY